MDSSTTPEMIAAAKAARLAAIESYFTYHPPKEGQPAKYVVIREKAREFALMIDSFMPDGDDKKRAIDSLRTTVMIINQGIACEGINFPG
jgi:hypothetical protein